MGAGSEERRSAWEIGGANMKFLPTMCVNKVPRIWLCAFFVGYVACVLTAFPGKPAEAAETPCQPIVMMWQVKKNVTDETLRRLHGAGVTVIQHFGMPSWSDAEVKRYLEKAGRHHLKVIASLWPYLERRGKNRKWTLTDRAKSFIRKWRRSNVIFAWHGFDEPKEPKKRATKSEQIAIYKAIKELDPSRPVLVSNNDVTQEQFDKFYSAKAFDIAEFHAYVNSDLGARQIKLLKLIRANWARRYPIIITIRAFNSPGWKSLGQRSLKEQYDFFVRDSGLTRNWGYYGWNLTPSRGIADVPDLSWQFFDLSKQVRRNGSLVGAPLCH